MRIAFFSPVNPQQSGISDYSEELLPALASGANIDLIVADGVTPGNQAIRQQFPIIPASQFASRHQQQPYDLCLYQMGNNTAGHRYMDAFIQTYPGIVTLHDYALHHFYAEIFADDGRYDEYETLMHAYYGQLGQQIAERFRQGLTSEYVFYHLPFYQRAVNPSLGVIVHSSYVQAKLLHDNPAYRVALIPMGIVPPDLSQFDVADLRRAYHLPEEAFVIASMGFIIADKRIRELLRAFARIVSDIPQARCLFVGKESPGFDVRALIQELQIAERVIITGYTPYQTYLEYIALSDVCVSLRHPTVRATSANILKMMAFAKPVLVSDLCELLDLPDTACIKIPLDATEENRLIQALQRLYYDREGRLRLGRQARTLIETHHAMAQAAEKYLTFCRTILDEKLNNHS